MNLINSLKETKSLEKVGGIKKVNELVKQGQVFISSKNINFYIKQLTEILHENYKRRILIQYGYNIIKLSYNREIPNQLLHIKASQYLNYIDKYLTSKNLDNLQDLIGSLIINIQEKQKVTNIYKKAYSGFKEFDILTNGLPNGDLIVVAGRPSMGKTSFSINIAYNLLKYFSAQICIFSLEMTNIQILHKLISIGSKVSLTSITSGRINSNEWSIIQIVCNELLKSEIYINDEPNISIEEIKQKSKTLIRKSKYINTIIIDYLQLIQVKNSPNNNRHQELSYITRELKILAQILNTPIIILSQLNRNIDKRINKKPLLSDLKESGCLNYQTAMNIDPYNTVSLKSIYKKALTALYYVNNPFINYKNKIQYLYNNYQQNTYIFYQYNFTNQIYYKLKLFLTNNHKLLSCNYWTEQQNIHEDTIGLKYNTNYKLKKNLTQNIIFYNYDLVYDVVKYEYTNFICQNIILHNSIEQDADIVVMLYKSSSNKDNIHTTKTIDIFIAKNRNGPTGSIQLEFNTENTIFSGFQNTLSST